MINKLQMSNNIINRYGLRWQKIYIQEIPIGIIALHINLKKNYKKPRVWKKFKNNLILMMILNNKIINLINYYSALLNLILIKNY